MDRSRRRFLKEAAGLLAASAQFAFPLPRALAQGQSEQAVSFSSSANELLRKVVLVHLNGGNDGLNTVVPYRNELYKQLRPTLALHLDEVLPLTEHLALNGSMTAMEQLYRDGKLAIFPCVGYPHQSRSHYRSVDIWSSGIPDAVSSDSWLPANPTTVKSLDDVIDCLRADKTNRTTGFYQVSFEGFDTHANQKNMHTELLGKVSDEIGRYHSALEKDRLDGDVLTIVFSEFGRQVSENFARGTDHGGGGPLFILGSQIKGGLYGNAPDLKNLNRGDLACETDFRSVYSTILSSWLRMDHNLNSFAAFGVERLVNV